MIASTAHDDAALRDFIARGYLSIQTHLPASYHERIHDQLAGLLLRDEDLENGVLWHVPDLHQVFDHPAVRSALTSILGPGYLMNPHTYGHLSRPGSPGHAWHKDSYVLDHNTRHPRPRWLISLYSPQRVTEALGPTTIIPGWQYHEDLGQIVEQSEGLALTTDAGTVTLLHPDMWHGASPNRSQENRFVLKFLFERRWEPRESPPGCEPARWRKHEDDRVPLLSMGVWRWLHGQHSPPAEEALADDGQIAVLRRALDSASETSRLRAAYALGRLGSRTVALLVAALRRDAIAATAAGSVRRPSDPKGINPTAPPPAQALATLGEAAASALRELADDPSWYVRMTAAETLGNIGPAAASVIPTLTQLAQDSHWWVRRNAIEALGRIGSSGAPAGETMVRALADSDGRVRLNAAVALGKLTAPPAYASSALRRAQETDGNRYVRYYARMALDYAQSHGFVEDTSPVRSGWSAMQAVSARGS